MRLPFKNLSISIISLIITILFSEILLRNFIEPIPSGWGWNNSPRKHLSEFNENNENQLGCRGQKIAYGKKDIVILILGDSQVEAATSPLNRMPEILLERFLIKEKINVKVFSLGVSGWSQDQQLIALQEYYKKFRADMVFIWATPKNDFWENAFPDRSLTRKAGRLKPTYRLENSNLIGPYFTGNSYYRSSLLLQLLFSGIQGYKNETLEQYILEKWEEELPAPHQIHQFSDDPQIYSEEIDLKLFSEELENFSDKNDITILTHEDYLNSRSHFSPFAKKRSKRDEYLIQITERIFEKIKEVAISHGSEFYVFYPVRHDYDIIYQNCVGYVKMYSLPDTKFTVELDYLKLLQKILNKSDLIYFDVGKKCNLSFSNTDRHLSEKGNSIVMEHLARLIIKSIRNK